MRESNRGQTVCGASVYNLGGNSGSFWIVTTVGTDTATAMERRRSEEKGRNGERGRSCGDNRH